MQWYEMYYDSCIDIICPDYKKALGILVDNIPKSAKTLIELGYGTGNLTELIANRSSGTEIIAYDNDSNQLEKAAEKLGGYDNVTLINQDIINAEIPKDSIVVSSLLFHLVEPEKRNDLFQKLIDSDFKEIYVFDRLKGETAEEEKRYQEYFRDNLIKNKLPNELVETLVKENRGTNDPDTLTEQIKFFGDRGYNFDILYRNPNHGFIVYKIWR